MKISRSRTIGLTVVLLVNSKADAIAMQSDSKFNSLLMPDKVQDQRSMPGQNRSYLERIGSGASARSTTHKKDCLLTTLRSFGKAPGKYAFAHEIMVHCDAQHLRCRNQELVEAENNP